MSYCILSLALRLQGLPVKFTRHNHYRLLVSPMTLSKDLFLARVRIMAKVTSKLQVTIPKRIAERYAIAPGDDIEFVAAGEGIRIVPAAKGGAGKLSTAERLRLYRAASARQRAREKSLNLPGATSGSRGWTRAELYTRGKPR